MKQDAAVAPIHGDMIELLVAARNAERDLYAMLEPEQRDAPGAIGEWSAKDVLGHLAAWRAVEARRLDAIARGKPAPADDPPPDEPVDAANARLHAERSARNWDEVVRDADASVDALTDAIRLSAHDVLCECEGTVVGIGSSGTNHSLGHLMDVVTLIGDDDAAARYTGFAREVEGVLARRHLRPRDTGVMLYNMACHYAISGNLDEARRVLRLAFAQRPELVDYAPQDPDLEQLRGEITALA
jgi:hypothetical protein